MKKLAILAVISLFIGITSGNTHNESFDDPVLGDESAENMIEVYEDLECPFCKRLEEDTMPMIEENYVETGEAKIIWNDNPLEELHPWAKQGAVVMECVYREGGNDAFWDVKDKVFANQDEISTDNVEEKIKSYAYEEGLEEGSLDQCITSGDAEDAVEEDINEADERGASGTPTTFVNGEKIVGAQPYESFEGAIEGNGDTEESDGSEENDSDNLSADELKQRLEQKEENLSNLESQVEKQEEELNEVKEEQNQILDILSTIMDILGL